MDRQPWESKETRQARINFERRVRSCLVQYGVSPDFLAALAAHPQRRTFADDLTRLHASITNRLGGASRERKYNDAESAAATRIWEGLGLHGFIGISNVLAIADAPVRPMTRQEARAHRQGQYQPLGLMQAIASFSGDPQSYRSLFVFSDFAEEHRSRAERHPRLYSLAEALRAPSVTERISHSTSTVSQMGRTAISAVTSAFRRGGDDAGGTDRPVQPPRID